MLIEGENDQFVEKECEWILEHLGDNIPLHFSAFTPKYQFKNRPATKYETLEKAYNTAKKMGLKYVYTGNLTTPETSTTYCKNCGEAIIKRDGYNLFAKNIKDDKCKFCGTKVDGRI